MSLQSTDPEYTQRLGAFLEEVKNEPDSMLEPTTRWLTILAVSYTHLTLPTICSV